MTDRLLRHSMASGVSGVTERTPSGTGAPLSLLVGPPAVSASFSRWDMLLPLAPVVLFAGASRAVCCCR